MPEYDLDQDLDKQQILVEDIARRMAERYGLRAPEIRVLEYPANLPPDAGGVTTREKDHFIIRFNKPRYLTDGQDGYVHEVAHTLYMENNPFFSNWHNIEGEIEWALAEYVVLGKNIFPTLGRLTAANLSNELVATYFGCNGREIEAVADPRVGMGTLMKNWHYHAKAVEVSVAKGKEQDMDGRFSQTLELLSNLSMATDMASIMGRLAGWFTSGQIVNDRGLFVQSPAKLGMPVFSAYSESTDDESFKALLVEKLNLAVNQD